MRGGTWTGAGAAASVRSAATGESEEVEESRRRSAVELELEVKVEMSTRRRAGAADMKKRTQTVAMAAPSTKDTSGLTLLMSPPFIGYNYNLVVWGGRGAGAEEGTERKGATIRKVRGGCGGTRQSEFPFNTRGSGAGPGQVVVKRNGTRCRRAEQGRLGSGGEMRGVMANLVRQACVEPNNLLPVLDREQSRSSGRQSTAPLIALGGRGTQVL